MKTVLITGASRGIGAAAAVMFAKNGYNVAINYKSNDNAANDVLDQCLEFGVKARIYKADVTDYSACEEIVGKINGELGGPDILVNNAGITRDGLILRMSPDSFDDVINANLKSVFNLTRLVSPIMVKARWGRIINLSSVAGVSGNAGQANYSASKAGVIGFTKACSKELGGRSITVNAVAPGFIETDMTNVLNESTKTKILEATALKRFGCPEDIASLILFLASDGGAFITGQVICADGGLSL